MVKPVALVSGLKKMVEATGQGLLVKTPFKIKHNFGVKPVLSRPIV